MANIRTAGHKSWVAMCLSRSTLDYAILHILDNDEVLNETNKRVRSYLSLLVVSSVIFISYFNNQLQYFSSV